MIHRVFLQFPGDAGFTEVTHLVIDRQRRLTRRLMNDDWRSTVDTYQFALKHDETIIGLIYNATEKINAYVQEQESSDYLITGTIDPTYYQSRSQFVETMSLEIVDVTQTLDRPLEQSIRMPDKVGDPEPPIFLSGSLGTSILYVLLDDAGFGSSIDPDVPDIPDTVLHVAWDRDELTYREAIDTLLSEHGYVLHALGNGLITWTKFDQDTWEADATIDEDKLTGIPFTVEREYRPEDGVELEWARPAVLEDVRIYDANLPVDPSGEEGPFRGVDIAPGDYYPSDSDIEDTYQTYSDRWLDTPYLSTDTRKQNRDISLISTSDHRVEFSAESGVVVDLEEYEAHRARIRFQNTTGEIKKIYFFAIYGTALYRRRIEHITVPDTAQRPDRYRSEHVFDSVRAERTATHRARHIRFSAFRYTFGLKFRVPVGTVVNLKNDKPNIDTIAIITAVEYSGHQALYRHEAVGVTNYATEIVTTRGDEPQQAAAAIAALQDRADNSPTFPQIDTGYDSAVGTREPVVPIIGVQSGFMHNEIVIPQQEDLRWLRHNEIQVTNDPDAESDPESVDWFELGFVEWFSGTAGGFYIDTVGRVLHVIDPDTLDPEDPEPFPLWYRARRRTREGLTTSTWSDPVRGDFSLVKDGSLPANSIKANKLEAAILEALIANITETVTIGDDGLVGASADGLRRMVLTRDQLKLQTKDGETWVTQLRVGVDTATFDQFLPFVFGGGLVDIHADVDGIRFGTIAPEGTEIFPFDEDLDSLSGDESFSGSVTYDIGVHGDAAQGDIESSFNVGGGDWSLAWWAKDFVIANLSTVRVGPYSMNVKPLSGLTWNDISSDYPHSGIINSVVLRDDGVGIAGGADGQIARTEDHGLSWTDITASHPLTNPGFDVALRDDGVGIMVSAFEIIRTVDHGVSWTDISSAYPFSHIARAVTLRDDGVGLAGGQGGQIARTTDSGVSWTSISSEYPHSGLIWSIVLRDDGVGISVGASGQIARTEDHGASWTSVSYPHSLSILGVCLRDDGVGIAVGDSGQIARTTDHGVSWTDISGAYPHSGGIEDVVLRDDGVGIAVGISDEIARTTDHGVSWTDISSAYPFSHIARAVTLRDDGVGVAVGFSGEIARTADAVDLFAPADPDTWTHHHLRRTGSIVELYRGSSKIAELTGVSISPAPLQIDTGSGYVDDLLWISDIAVAQSVMDEYRTLGQPWTNDADTRDMRIQARDGRDINLVTTGGGKILFNGTTCPYPIDSTYIQFPGLPDPGALWPGTNWSIAVSDTHGVFFRTEGDRANAFNGGVQGHAVQSHSHAQRVDGLDWDTHHDTNLNRNSGSRGNMSTRNVLHTGSSGSNETRPRNITIRVWKRDS